MKFKKSLSPLPKSNVEKSDNLLSFPDAIKLLMVGNKIRREEWSDTDEYCLLKDNFLMIHKNGKFHTWVVSEGDLFAMDWVIIK